jgi:hypothetical protein
MLLTCLYGSVPDLLNSALLPPSYFIPSLLILVRTRVLIVDTGAMDTAKMGDKKLVALIRFPNNSVVNFSTAVRANYPACLRLFR